LAGGLVAALALYGILRTLPGIADSRTAFDTVTAGFGEHSIIQAPLAAVLLLEMIGAAIIVAVFLGTAGRDNNSRSAAPVAVGLSFAVLLQLGLSVGNLPFNPARAVASAVFSSGWAVEQVWVFVAAPLVGAAVAGLVLRSFGSASTSGAPGQSAVAAGGADNAADELETGGLEAGDVRAAGGGNPAGKTAGKGATARADTGSETSEAQEFFEGGRG
jgi:aquaporin Z